MRTGRPTWLALPNRIRELEQPTPQPRTALQVPFGGTGQPEDNAPSMTLSRTVDLMAGPQLWRIELLIETDDRERVDQIAADVGRLACDHDDVDHPCDPPWMVMTSPVDPSDEDDVRDMLNR
jgi:hypothetical protein